MSIRKRVFIIVLILIPSFFCAVLLDRVIDMVVTNTREADNRTVIFSNALDAYSVFDCTIDNNTVSVTGADPQFAIRATDDEISMIQIILRNPVAENTTFQLFYDTDGSGFSERNSLFKALSTDETEKTITLPKAVYRSFRFDFESTITIDKICTVKETLTKIESQVNMLRSGVIALVICIPFIIAVLHNKKTICIISRLAR